MAGIGLGLEQHRVGGEFAPPRLAARFLRGDELREVDRPVLAPDAAGRAEIGNARFRADAGPGQRHDPLGASGQFHQSLDVLFLRHNLSLRIRMQAPMPGAHAIRSSLA